MAAGNLLFQANDGKIASVSFEDGASNNVEIVIPKEGGSLVAKDETGNIDNLITQNYNISPFGKNYIINGNFDIWDYATSQTSAGYGSDNRWSNTNTGTTKTHSQITCTDTERALFNANYFSRTIVSSVALSTNRCAKIQFVEDVTKLAGKTITLSFWAKADSNKNIAIEFYQFFGSGGSPSTAISISPQLVSLSSSWQKKTITVTIPSIVGKTLGTDGVNTTRTDVWFWFDAGSSFDLRTNSLGQQSGTFDIAQVQLEEGNTATAFEYRNITIEKTLCARYLPVIENGSAISGMATSTTIAVLAVPFSVEARVAPTGVIASGFGTLVSSAGGGLAGTVLTFVASSSNSARINTGVASGLTAGNGTILITPKILFTGCEL